jgi:hypothetical protein
MVVVISARELSGELGCAVVRLSRIEVPIGSSGHLANAAKIEGETPLRFRRQLFLRLCDQLAEGLYRWHRGRRERILL